MHPCRQTWTAICKRYRGFESLSLRQTNKKGFSESWTPFYLSGEMMDENPSGSTGASIAGVGTLERSDDGPEGVRRIAPNNPSAYQVGMHGSAQAELFVSAKISGRLAGSELRERRRGNSQWLMA